MKDSDKALLLAHAKKVLADGIDLETRLKGLTPLMAAAYLGDINLVKELLLKGANKEAITTEANTTNGTTPLILAACSGSTEIVRLLLAAGAQIDHKSGDDSTALVKAADGLHVETCRLLLELGADANGAEGNPPLVSVACSVFSKKYNGPGIEIINLLLKAGADVNARYEGGDTALGVCGTVEVAQLLLTAGAEINARSDLGFTPLMNAAGQGGSYALTKLYLEAGANKDAKNSRGETASMLAVQAGETDIEDLLNYFGSFQYRLNQINYNGEVDPELVCPISRKIMNDPVTISTGHTFDRDSLKKLAKYNKDLATNEIPEILTCPLTRRPFKTEEIENGSSIIVKQFIEKFVSSKEKEAKVKKEVRSQLSVYTTQNALLYSLFLERQSRQNPEPTTAPKPN